MKWLQTEKQDSIYKITMNRPEVRNAFNAEMISELTTVFRTIPAEIRVVTFQGNGKAFCAGADLEWMRSMVDYSFEENKKDSLALYEMFTALRECPLPVITTVHGAAMGGALGLLAASDIVIADVQAQFCFSEVKLGIAPAVISRFVLEKSMLGIASPWMISGKIFGAKEAQPMGLVHEVAHSIEEREKLLKEWIETFLQAAPGAVAETKKLLGRLSRLSEAEIKDITCQLIAQRRVSQEGQEGLRSFLAKQKPSWSL